MSRMVYRLAVLSLAALFVGCSGDEFERATVTGKVTCGGEPVPGGSLSFSPVAEEGATAEVGQSSRALIQEDGTFEVSIVVGKVLVSFSKPDLAEAKEDAADGAEETEEMVELAAQVEIAEKLAKIPCNQLEETEFAITPGENTLNFELVQGRRDREDD